MVSDRYKFKSDDLWQLYKSEKIEHDQFISQLEQLKNEELNLYELKFDKKETEKEIWKYEINKRQIVELEEHQRKIQEQERIARQKEDEYQKKIQEQNIIAQQKEIERLNNRSPQEKYRDEIPTAIEEYRDGSKHYRTIHNFFQWILIIGPVLATGATSALLAGNVFKWAAAIISIGVSIAASATGYYKFREKSFYLQQTADAMEQEFSNAQLGIDVYEGKEPDKTLILLAKRVQQLKLEQKTREQHLDQPPETKQIQN